MYLTYAWNTQRGITWTISLWLRTCFNWQKYLMKWRCIILAKISLMVFMTEMDFFASDKIHNRLGKINICWNVCIHTTVPAKYHSLMLIFPSSGLDMQGNTSTAYLLGLGPCQQQTHVVANRYAPCTMLMQTEMLYTKLKLLNGDMYCFFTGSMLSCISAIHWARY